MTIAIRSGMSPRTPILLSLLPALLLAFDARADMKLPEGETYFSVGPLFSFSGRSHEEEKQLGLGVEATLNFVDKLGALGAFAQVQLMDGQSNGQYARLCGGLQGTLLFLGMELGLMHETADRNHVATTGLHLAPYVAFVFGSLGVRFGIPLTGPGTTGPGGQEKPRHGSEVGLVLTLKLPFQVDGPGGITPLGR
ncbi:hypothetical protein JY651_50755 [Pyxidicoccus parkwayensis]|uniref:Outer membrane protein beta-barrel domain-containing protein n=1 Tax=Pyxidicoccus parkwayensis TaxID=2813578 RepID=A0ABX7NWV3_9BACT|nr:hypothetical protein [Pyxidicoccus parkwaysis]QSQ23270.1 hypothetical protein JY651_50755 [Pyxidicoccus parkwaysis]